MFMGGCDHTMRKSKLGPIIVIVFGLVLSGVASADTLNEAVKKNGRTSVRAGVVPQESVDQFIESPWVWRGMNFCAPPRRNASGTEQEKAQRKRMRKKQIQRLSEKYLSEGTFSILDDGAIKGARDMDNPWQVETSHYLVKTDISKRASGEIALLMELLYDALLRSPFFPDRDYKFDRMKVVVTKNQGELQEQLPQLRNMDDRGTYRDEMDEPKVYAHYFVGKHEKLHNVLWLNGTKQFLDKILKIHPQWFYEGFSRVFAYSTLKTSRRAMRMVPGALPRHHLEVLWDHIRWEDRGERYRFLQPFSELIRMNNDFISSDDEAQLWGVMHFLLNWKNGKLVGKMSEYIGYLHGKDKIKRDQVQLFQQMFGFHPKQLRVPWEQYIFALGN